MKKLIQILISIWIIINYLTLSAIRVNATFKINKNAIEIKFIPELILTILNTLCSSLTSFSDVTIKLSELTFVNVFNDYDSLFEKFTSFYKNELLAQIYKIIFNMDLIGNPVNLVEGLGTGIFEFFNEPRKGLLKGPEEFGLGIAKGTRSLVSNIVGGGFKSASKITGSLLTASKNLSSLGTEEEVIVKEIVIEPTASELYAKKIAATKITLLSSPKETTKTKIFTAPYLLKIEDAEGKAIESFELSVIYPAKRQDGEIVFTETLITSDSEGIASFLPPVPEFSFNSEISFYPKYEKENLSETELLKINKIAEENAVKAAFKVQTNLKAAGGALALVDFNQNGKAITSNPISSSKLLMTLMKLGFVRIGNAPQEISDAVIRGDEKKIYSLGKAIVPSFLIFGSVNIDSDE